MFYFLHGNSPLLELETQNILKKITAEKGDIKKNYFDLNSKEEEKFLSALSTNSLFGGNEIFILKRSEILKSKGITNLLKTIKAFDLSSKDVLVVYEEISSYGKVLKEYELNKTTLKLIDEIGENVNCSSDKFKKDVLKYVVEKLSISDYEAEKLIEIIGGEDFYLLNNEIEKIITFLDGEKFELEKVIPILSSNNEFDIYHLIENFLKNKKSKDLIEYMQIKDGLHNSILYILSEELLTILKLKSLINSSKISETDSYNSFKSKYDGIQNHFLNKFNKSMHPYQVFLKLPYCKLFSEDFLKRNLNSILNLEYLTKSGVYDAKISIESYLLGFYNTN